MVTETSNPRREPLSIYEMTLFFIIRFLNDHLEKNLPFGIV
ncbi:hypothetical protein EUBIFOR_02446 [Holdemanella biformis DSM 3989]|uniref:Uncharacterized protein n=1 Tax=Holdemanella biformis DSM 3989 TaxID=518637 RepID=B7CE11_9FIRM|nr:hypothetical protein EUBIFOR_02446 [Holdemanella biformis DSM 3989]